jgi:hypothetical protein
MIRPLPLSLCLIGAFSSVSAGAAERVYSVSSFDRLRVDGPFRVIVTTGVSPGGKAEGDPAAIDQIDMRVEGTTLILRAGAGGWGERPVSAGGGTPLIRLATPMLRAATMFGGGDVTITGKMRAQRVELTMTGSGTMRAGGVDADQFVGMVTGSGSMTLAGRAAKVRLSTDGPARMEAGGLVADDLTVRTDGNGEMTAQARYTATIASAGVGSVTIYGKPTCTIRGNANGPVNCGNVMSPVPQAAR